MNEKITLHRALAELKLADSKISKLTEEIVPSAIHQKGKLMNGVMQESDFKRMAQAKYDSVTDLIERKHKLKKAVVAANAVTTMKIGDKIMTIADAITYKSLVEQKKALIETLKSRHNSAIASLNRNNAIVDGNVQRLLEAAFGKENVKVSEGDMAAIRKPYMEANEYHLYDPLKVEEKIAKLEEEVLNFETDVDAALSEINAITYIDL